MTCFSIKTLGAGIAAAILATLSLPNLASAQQLPKNCSAISQKYPDLKDRSIVVGYNTAEANYTAADPNDPSKIIGIEPTIIEIASKCLGFKYSLLQSDFSGLIPALLSGRVQLIMGGMYASDERAKQINFVEYMKAGEATLVRAGNPKKLTDLQHTCDITAAEVVGTVENEILAKQSDACKKEGKGPIAPLAFQSNDRAFAALSQGRADLFMTDAGVAAYLAKTSPQSVQVGYAVPSTFVFGIGVRKGDDSLLNGLFAVVHVMYEDSLLKQQVTHWGFADSQLIEPAVKTQ